MSRKDYVNPSYKRSDHPSFNEKKHNLVVDSQGASNRVVDTESGTLRFEDGIAVLPNDERAGDIIDEMNETRANHPHQYALIEDRPTVNTDPIHHYHFGYNRRYADAWERIFGDKEDEVVEMEIEVQEDTDGEPEDYGIRPGR